MGLSLGSFTLVKERYLGQEGFLPHNRGASVIEPLTWTGASMYHLHSTCWSCILWLHQSPPLHLQDKCMVHGHILGLRYCPSATTRLCPSADVDSLIARGPQWSWLVSICRERSSVLPNPCTWNSTCVCEVQHHVYFFTLLIFRETEC